MQGRFEKVLDLTDMALLVRLGVDRNRYSEMLYETTQKIGEAVGFLGFEAMLVPNARHDSTNLVAFPDNCDLDEIAEQGREEVDWKGWRARLGR